MGLGESLDYKALAEGDKELLAGQGPPDEKTKRIGKLVTEMKHHGLAVSTDFTSPSSKRLKEKIQKAQANHKGSMFTADDDEVNAEDR